MKITLLTTIYPHKGISIYSDHLIKSLMEKNIDMEIVCFNKLYSEKIYPGGTTDHTQEANYGEVKIKKIIKWYNPFSYFKAALAISGQILHIQWWTIVMFPIFLPIILYSKLRKIKVVVTMHNILPHESKKIAYLFVKIITKLSNHFIVHNENNKKKLNTIFNIPNKKISVVPIGLYKQKGYNKKIEKNLAIKKLKLNPNIFYILYFGTIRDYKGLDVLLKAMPQIIKNHPKARLIIAGSVWGSWKKYQNIIDNNNLSPYIIKYLNYISNEKLSLLISASNLAVLPYKYFDASSGLLKTLLYFNKAAVVSDVGDFIEVIKNDDFIFEANNNKELASKINKLIGNSNKIKLQELYLNNIKNKYGWENISEKHYQLYNKMINDK